MGRASIRDLSLHGRVLRASILVYFLIAATLAALIFVRGQDAMPAVRFIDVLIWQALVWLPWLGMAPLLARAFDVGERDAALPWGGFRQIGAGLALIGIHVAWFVILSALISPYLEAPRTRYGVFPYFFIFWGALDVILAILIVSFVRHVRVVARLLDMEAVQGSNNERLVVRDRGIETVIDVGDINWIGAEDYYARLVTRQGRFLIRRSLKSLADMLPHRSFVQIHRSTIVNTAFVSVVSRTDTGAVVVELADGTRRPASRAGYQRLRELLGD